MNTSDRTLVIVLGVLLVTGATVDVLKMTWPITKTVTIVPQVITYQGETMNLKDTGASVSFKVDIK